MSDKHFEIEIIVNGKPEWLKVDDDQPMDEVVKEALERSGNSGQSADQWELRDEDGRILDVSKTVGQLEIKEGAKLFLNLKAGVGGTAMAEPQFVDPAVSRRKFHREIAEFRAEAVRYRRRGWFLADAEFPHALVVLATGKTQPISILCGILFDYSNYDAAPPSVRLVHPLTREPYKWSEVPTRLPRMSPVPDGAHAVAQPLPPGVEQALPPGVAQALAQGHAQVAQAVPLMQAHGDDDIPFLCIAGVREYHEHPAHTGDAWETHRRSGAGRLIRLVEIISKYGPETIDGFEVQFAPQIRFRQGVPPE